MVEKSIGRSRTLAKTWLVEVKDDGMPPVIREIFGHNRLRSECLQVQPVTCWHPLFFFTKLGYILKIPLKWSVIVLQSWTSTGYLSNSTGSFETNYWFSLLIVCRIRWTRMNINSLKEHLVEGPVTYDFTLHLAFVTTLHDIGGVLGGPLDTFFWAITISWPWLLAHVRAALHYSVEVYWSVKNLSPRHGYLRRGMVCRRHSWP